MTAAQRAPRATLGGDCRVAVLGGGIAGLSAATVLCERGARGHLFEKERVFGGRAASWVDGRGDGRERSMERGFHAFFRHYYNLRSVLRRVDPELSLLEPLEDYPILGPDGAVESFAGLPKAPPFNVASLTRRTATLGWRDLLHVGARAALEMLAYEPERTYRRFDSTTAAAYLDSLAFPPRAREMLFSVFSHSFFNPESEMSAAELLMMFHFYFMGNREGLIFDVCRRPMSEAFWTPLGERAALRGIEPHLGAAAEKVEKGSERKWRVRTGERSVEVDALVLALPVAPLRALVASSPDLGDARWRRDIEALEVTRPFAVWRMWLDRPTRAGRSPFAGTAGFGLLDNISLYHLFQDDSRAWAAESGGSVVELHAYAVDETIAEEKIREELRAGLEALYPELAGAEILDEIFLLHRDCPAFAVGGHARRPGVAMADPSVALCGDFVKMPFPSALMERAAASGIAAANRLLGARGVAPEPLPSIAPRGLLGWRPPFGRMSGEASA